MKTKILIATNNQHKLSEMRQILGEKFDLVSLSDENIVCDPDENGQTFYDNALIKATEIAKHTTLPVLADDTGLCVNALGGQPGVHSARYAGNHDSAQNRAKLLAELQNATDRTAYFQTVVVLLTPSGKVISAQGRVDGYITTQELGDNGFGYDSVFFSEELGKTFGQCTDNEKNAVSHRGRALQNLLEILQSKTQID